MKPVAIFGYGIERTKNMFSSITNVLGRDCVGKPGHGDLHHIEQNRRVANARAKFHQFFIQRCVKLSIDFSEAHVDNTSSPTKMHSLLRDMTRATGEDDRLAYRSRITLLRHRHGGAAAAAAAAAALSLLMNQNSTTTIAVIGTGHFLGEPKLGTKNVSKTETRGPIPVTRHKSIVLY